MKERALEVIYKYALGNDNPIGTIQFLYRNEEFAYEDFMREVGTSVGQTNVILFNLIKWKFIEPYGNDGDGNPVPQTFSLDGSPPKNYRWFMLKNVRENYSIGDFKRFHQKALDKLR